MPKQQSTGATSVNSKALVFAHVGDLHLTDIGKDGPPVLHRREVQLQTDLKEILHEIASAEPGSIDFIYIPGDIAENGCQGEYQFLEDQLGTTRRFELNLVPGDHDRALGTMADFKAFRKKVAAVYGLPPASLNHLEPFPASCLPLAYVPSDKDANGCAPKPLTTGRTVRQYYYSKVIQGVACIFLDLVSAGFGRKGFGLDFRLGAAQMCWLRGEIAEAKAHNRPCAVFMHCYPVDMADGDEKADLAGLFWNAGVHLVEMGHTHYNELAPDGRTVYAAARSVGQNEDGPVGYAIGAIHQTAEYGIVTSWRFKQLQLGWPFVLITSPADYRMATEALTPGDHIHVRALVLTDQTDQTLIKCSCQVDGGTWATMSPDPAHAGMYHLPVPWPPGSTTVSVKVTDGRGYDKDFYDVDTIEPVGIDYKPRLRPSKPGSDEQTVRAWGVKGVRGDQAGPNRGRHKW